jgi:hypothetical protein
MRISLHWVEVTGSAAPMNLLTISQTNSKTIFVFIFKIKN